MEVKFPLYNFLICAVYRSPSSVNPFWENFQISVEKALEYCPRLIITGDTNVDLLQSSSNRLVDLINTFNFRNAISEPTRQHALLDPVLFSDDCNVTFAEVIQVDRVASDHDATSVSFQVPVKLNLS